MRDLKLEFQIKTAPKCSSLITWSIRKLIISNTNTIVTNSLGDLIRNTDELTAQYRINACIYEEISGSCFDVCWNIKKSIES